MNIRVAIHADASRIHNFSPVGNYQIAGRTEEFDPDEIRGWIHDDYNNHVYIAEADFKDVQLDEDPLVGVIIAHKISHLWWEIGFLYADTSRTPLFATKVEMALYNEVENVLLACGVKHVTFSSKNGTLASMLGFTNRIVYAGFMKTLETKTDE